MSDLTKLSKETLRRIADQAREYTELLIESTRYFQRSYNTDKITPEIVKKASALADKFKKAPKMDLRNYR
jgi:hypothetical protein